MKRAEKVARRNRRKKDRSRLRTKAIVVTSSVATAGGMLVAGASPAGADFISGNTFDYSGTAVGNTLGLNAGDLETVFAPPWVTTATWLNEIGVVNGYGQNIGSYSTDPGSFLLTTSATVGLFADGTGGNAAAPGTSVTDCAQQWTYPSVTYGGCDLVSTDASRHTLDSVALTMPVPNLQSTSSIVTYPTLKNGDSVALNSTAPGEPTFAAHDPILEFECPPMPSGLDPSKCIGIGQMTGTSGNYSLTAPVSNTVQATHCSLWTNPCSLWVVEFHADSSHYYLWPLSTGTTLGFK